MNIFQLFRFGDDFPSNNEVRAIGQSLLGRRRGLDLRYDCKYLGEWRYLHIRPLEELRAKLQTLTKACGIDNAVIAVRVKRMRAIRDKLLRFEGMSMERMQDMAGARVIVERVEDVYRVADMLKTDIDYKDTITKTYDYIQSPKPDGYRGLHLVLRVPHPEYEGKSVRIELQIRTKTQHAWATALETADFGFQTEMKTGAGDVAMRWYFLLVGSLFATKENTPLPKALEGVDFAELLSQFVSLEKRLTLLDQLPKSGVETRIDETEYWSSEVVRTPNGWQIMTLDIAKKTLTTIPIFENIYGQEIFVEREYDTLPDRNVAVVLMKAGDEREIRAAYPNYFLDASELVRQIDLIRWGTTL
ncbi:MAG: RelA/SpoT domain-containing protein [Sutterellaceae bacterium]|nr:RelA/SpoT domain-containing protein [Sutterellaceae bacterium]